MTTSLSVGPIQHYVQGNSWFDLAKYQNLGRVNRVSVNLSASNLWLIDASKLSLVNDYAPRIAFVNESAANKSPIRLTTQGQTLQTATVFSDLSGVNSALSSKDAPLRMGDWVQTSTIAGGTKLDFSVAPNGVNNPNARALSTNPRLNAISRFNPDAPVYWTAYADPKADRIILAYEDNTNWGSDNDYNDGVIALDLGAASFRNIFQNYNYGQNPNISLRNATYVSVPFELHSTLGVVVAIAIVAQKWFFQRKKLQSKPLVV
ncbi:DUF4114 domain-containing protein [Alkalinema sp. FACHB-956]|uniref:DUF4114 domain-containing protein n=1 Tax=Alkalinema sp. FACHB-956 TaxID=2692768 RepID=UPI00168750E5|nr:DUF4114 domain-containing protein [Alkalinema sp. FACHB-956]MBD2325542.1 DUF4114 domain-containing protein [Alkalinema sp. FACHB-956]